jgi:hypothetical protein
MTAIPSWMARGDKVMPRMIGKDAPFPHLFLAGHCTDARLRLP